MNLRVSQKRALRCTIRCFAFRLCITIALLHVCGGSDGGSRSGADGRLRLLDAGAGGKVIAKSETAHTEKIGAVACGGGAGPVGSLLASGGGDCVVKLWDARVVRAVSFALHSSSLYFHFALALHSSSLY